MRPAHEIVRWVVYRLRAAREGQTLAEYAIMAGMMLAIVAILAVFMYTFRGHSTRILDLVASECP